jgi:hypothetical protein
MLLESESLCGGVVVNAEFKLECIGPPSTIEYQEISTLIKKMKTWSEKMCLVPSFSESPERMKSTMLFIKSQATDSLPKTMRFMDLDIQPVEELLNLKSWQKKPASVPGTPRKSSVKPTKMTLVPTKSTNKPTTPKKTTTVSQKPTTK